MKYQEAVSYIQEISKTGIVLGLDTMRELMRRLGNPQEQLKFIHIAGTNGKGSTLAFISSILKAAGYRTGCYVSPCVFSELEKVQIDGINITMEDAAEAFTTVIEACQGMQADGFCHPTAFEVETAMGFVYFLKKQCDFVVLETGMGGLEDATNVITTTLVSVLTSIGMDHMQFLGSSLEGIVRCKGGIIKQGSQVVLYGQREKADIIEKEVRRICEEKNAVLRISDTDGIIIHRADTDGMVFDYYDWHKVEISMMGIYQAGNAAVALETVEVLRNIGYDITGEAVRIGLKNAVWNGRFQKICHAPCIIIDGAHNPDAASRLTESVKMYFTNRRLLYIMGVLADKDYDEVARITAPLADCIYTVTPENKRALPADKLAECLQKYNHRVTAKPSVRQALEDALLWAREDGVIIAFGSLSYLENLTNRLKEMRT